MISVLIVTKKTIQVRMKIDLLQKINVACDYMNKKCQLDKFWDLAMLSCIRLGVVALGWYNPLDFIRSQ